MEEDGRRVQWQPAEPVKAIHAAWNDPAVIHAEATARKRKGGTDMKIVHVMSDGTIRDSIEGLVIPKGHPVYEVLKRMEMDKNRKGKRTEGQKTA